MIDFTQIKVWQKAHLVTLDVYRATNGELRRDRSLAAQTRRAAASVSTNIVEGCGASSQNELARYLQMALSSAGELEYHLLLSHDLTYLTTQRYEGLRSQVQEVKRMLTGFIRAVRAREAKRRRDMRRDSPDEKGSTDT
jgi:four helix bundle protein